MYLIPIAQLFGTIINIIYGKTIRSVRAEPFHFGFTNKKHENQETNAPGADLEYGEIRTNSSNVAINSQNNNENLIYA